MAILNTISFSTGTFQSQLHLLAQGIVPVDGTPTNQAASRMGTGTPPWTVKVQSRSINGLSTRSINGLAAFGGPTEAPEANGRPPWAWRDCYRCVADGGRAAAEGGGGGGQGVPKRAWCAYMSACARV